ncbi:hypothetical protein ACN28G_18195 [Micromonospora sp. WMMA1923]|uniref:hypothetical protein n=1 Tax=Micromonospora sp. WMMA1923 TaxID=3404125 RepID=UPI003B9652CE
MADGYSSQDEYSWEQRGDRFYRNENGREQWSNHNPDFKPAEAMRSLDDAIRLVRDLDGVQEQLRAELRQADLTDNSRRGMVSPQARQRNLAVLDNMQRVLDENGLGSHSFSNDLKATRAQFPSRPAGPVPGDRPLSGPTGSVSNVAEMRLNGVGPAVQGGQQQNASDPHRPHQAAAQSAPGPAQQPARR